MSVVRSFAAGLILVTAAAFGFASVAEGAPFRPTYWRLTGTWTTKRDAPQPTIPASSPFARLFDRPNADIISSSPAADSSRISTPPPPAAPSYGSYGLIAPAKAVPPRAEYDAFINFGGGPYRGEDVLTTGTAAPWYDSPVVRRFYDGGSPSGDQQSQFVNDVVNQVSRTYQRAGMSLDLTTDPNASAAHTMSVVSNTNFPGGPQAVGIAAMGYYGFSFIDKFGSVPTLDQLETAVAHNIAHEMMHTFGVDHIDKTGKYLDAAVTSWDVMVDPNAEFSADAIRELNAKDFKTTGLTSLSEVEHSDAEGQIVCQHCLNLASAGLAEDHEIAASLVVPTPVPEPSSLIAWSALAAAGAWAWGRRRR